MTIQLFNSILTMTTILKITTDIDKILPKKHLFNTAIYSNNYIVEHNKYTLKFSNSIEYHNLKCWKSYCIFNYHIENENDNNMIFNLDFIINKDNRDNNFIKIDYLEITNDFYNKKYYDYSKNLLNDDEVKLILYSLITFIENWAIKKNIKKIKIEIHSNLERYNEEFKHLGFIIKENKKLFNSNWIEIEKELK